MAWATSAARASTTTARTTAANFMEAITVGKTRPEKDNCWKQKMQFSLFTAEDL